MQDVVPDLAWVDKMTRQVTIETDRLEAELKGYKNNLIKESIRVSNASEESRALLNPNFTDGLR